MLHLCVPVARALGRPYKKTLTRTSHYPNTAIHAFFAVLQALGIFGDGPEVTSDDVETYGMNLAPPTPEEAAALGLSNSTVRLNAEEAANLGLLGPVSLTPEEAEKLGLHQQASGALVTQEDMDRLGLNDPVGWNASGFSHLLSIPAVSRAVDAQVTLKAREMVEQLMNQKQRVANKRHAGK